MSSQGQDNPSVDGAARSGSRQGLVILVALVIVGVAVWLLLARGGKSGGNEIVVGVLAPKTGFMSGHGLSIEMGARLAADEINARGGLLGGRKVRLVVLDTTSEPAGAAERAKELIDREKAVLLLGTGTSASTLAAIAPATTARVPFIYSLDGECKTCRPGSPSEANKYVYGSGFTERMVVKPFLEFLARKFKKVERFRIYYIGGDYVYPRTTNAYARQVAEGLGYETVGDEYADTSTQNYEPVIRRIQEAKPDLLIVTNPGASGVTFMRQAVLNGLDKQVVISGFATFDQEAIDAMGDASEGVYVVNRYSMHLVNSQNQAFMKAFREAYPDKPLLPGPTVAGGGYGSLMIAAKAFEKAGSTEPEKFYEAMRGLEADLPQGKVRVSPANNIFDSHLYIFQIRSQQYNLVEGGDLGMQSHPDFEGCSVR